MADIIPPGGTRRVLVKRHSISVRVTHWINVICLSFLLLTGLQIFNAHPNLYWGSYGADTDTPFISIGSAVEGSVYRGFARVGGIEVPTTGVLGISSYNGQPQQRAFPSWLTFPGYRDLGAGRNWHFFFAWAFVINGALYWLWGFLSGHFRRDLAPTTEELKPAHIAREIASHAKLRFPKGEEARHYNSLQKLAYLGVIFLLLPLMILTGLSMSPAIDAIAPWLVDLFGGRQSARTIHFIVASLTTGFVVVHLVMVLVSGVWNNLRSMVTGRYAIKLEGPAL